MDNPPTPRVPIITLLTDFGDNDGYVGAMKGVILQIVPNVHLVDISHNVSPQDIQQAASILASVYPYYPPHTIHLVVVDPGVGGQRQPVALQTSSGVFVAPDNGVLTYVLEQDADQIRSVKLDQKHYWLQQPSHTFHGRDIFSPVAAHLASGVPLEQVGSQHEQLVTIPRPAMRITPNAVQGEILRIDRFGNALTNIKTLRWTADARIEFQPDTPAKLSSIPRLIDPATARATFGWHTLQQVHQTYSQVVAGQALLLVGSTGELEISVNQGSAQNKLGLAEGDPVSLIFES